MAQPRRSTPSTTRWGGATTHSFVGAKRGSSPCNCNRPSKLVTTMRRYAHEKLFAPRFIGRRPVSTTPKARPYATRGTLLQHTGTPCVNGESRDQRLLTSRRAPTAVERSDDASTEGQSSTQRRRATRVAPFLRETSAQRCSLPAARCRVAEVHLRHADARRAQTRGAAPQHCLRL